MRIYVGAFLTEKVPGENDHDLWRSQLSLKKKKQHQILRRQRNAPGGAERAPRSSEVTIS